MCLYPPCVQEFLAAAMLVKPDSSARWPIPSNAVDTCGSKADRIVRWARVAAVTGGERLLGWHCRRCHYMHGMCVHMSGCLPGDPHQSARPHTEYISNLWGAAQHAKSPLNFKEHLHTLQVAHQSAQWLHPQGRIDQYSHLHVTLGQHAKPIA